MCALIRLIIDLNRFLELSLYDEDTPANPWDRRAPTLRFFVLRGAGAPHSHLRGAGVPRSQGAILPQEEHSL